MTYSEFMAGLYVKYHMVYVRSVTFIKFSKVKGSSSAGFEDMVAYKVDAERVLDRLKNKNMASALCLIAQGYLQWEIGEMLKCSDRMVRYYISDTKKLFKSIS